jgi:2',3'-cyclic-nucleotide 2'-phosphodiesterase (5'-nucleotidase family)
MKLKITFFIFLNICFINVSLSKKLQILHTNDLHSYFAGTRGGIGGYAQLKLVVDQLKEKASEQGIPTLFLDAGDFGEGSSFHFSNQGVDSLRALDFLGVDVAVLGNHDYILGGKELSRQMTKAKLKTKILSSNLVGKSKMGLLKLMPDYADYNFGDMKVRIFGLSTNEIHFMYPLRPLGYISNYIKAGIKQAEKAKKDKIDFTIALTHIGVDADIKLVEKTSSINLVVGGHDHKLLKEPKMISNLVKNKIPVVQAGSHSGFIGSIIIDIKGNGKFDIVDYKMTDIAKDMPQDKVVEDFVNQAYQARELYFGRSWDEVIGFSEIPLSGNINGQTIQNRTCWSAHIAKLTKDVSKADLGVQVDNFNGEQIEPGPITFGDLVDNFSHLSRWDDNRGWHLSRAMVSGFLIKKVVEILTHSPISENFTFAGLQAKEKETGRLVNFDTKKHSINDLHINGEKLQSLRNYSVGMPSEVPYGLNKMIGFFGYLVFNSVRTVPNSHYWEVVENYIKSNSPLRCLENDDLILASSH